MSRRPYGKRRALGGLVAMAFFVGLVPAIAYAQTPAPQPVIDSAPAEVKYGRTAVIKGHLGDGTPGDEIELQQRRGDSGWQTIARRPVNSKMKVRFERDGLHKTSDYRLAWWNTVEEVETHSKVVTVDVKPRIILKVRPNDIFVDRKVDLSGRVYPEVAGRSVVLQQKVGGEWRTLEGTSVGDGRFEHTFKARHKGYRKVRAVFEGDVQNSAAKVTKPLTIYRADMATWYGPGFYGNSTACGKTLTTETLGVAHRTLPCGAKVSILYHGRSITVSVIDRGPYSGSANWDLTQETAERLGFSGTDEIGVTR